MGKVKKEAAAVPEARFTLVGHWPPPGRPQARGGQPPAALQRPKRAARCPGHCRQGVPSALWRLQQAEGKGGPRTTWENLCAAHHRRQILPISTHQGWQHGDDIDKEEGLPMQWSIQKKIWRAGGYLPGIGNFKRAGGVKKKHLKRFQ